MIRAIASAALLTFALTACGQKPGVHVEGGGNPLAIQEGGAVAEQGGTVTDGSGGQTAAPAGGTTTDDGTAAGGAQTSTGTSTDSSGGTSGGTSGATAASGGGGGSTDSGGGQTTASGGEGGEGGGETQAEGTQQQQQVRGSDRTGAGADKFVFASHAPVTGAAPLPTTSFEKSGDLYWRNLIERRNETVLGRSKVELIFRDDKYDPNSARQVCRELESVAFTVSGGGGTDQIQACGQFAGVAKFPYFSAGVTEAGLRGNPWYFAASMSYRQQGPLLAQLVKKQFPGKKVAAIITDTPNFDDARDGWEAGVKQQGLNYYKTLRHPKGDTSWYAAFAQELQREGVEVVYILSSPVDYIRFAQKADEQGDQFQYVGVGVSMGLNAVLGSGCDWVDGGMFFSPFPGLDWGRKNVPEFFEAAKDFGVPNDDIALALWGQNAVLHQLLQRYEGIYGTDVTREDFRDMVETTTGVETGVFPALNFSPDDHFGSKQVHLLQADCASGEYKTIATFASSF